MKRFKPNDNHFLVFPCVGKTCVSIQLSPADIWECKKASGNMFLLQNNGVSIALTKKDLKNYFEEVL